MVPPRWMMLETVRAVMSIKSPRNNPEYPRLNADDLETKVDRAPHHRADGRVHAGGVAAAGQHSDAPQGLWCDGHGLASSPGGGPFPVSANLVPFETTT